MKNKIRSFFKENKFLKLVSLCIAFGIWLMVVNISNPEMKSTISTGIDIDYGESLTNIDKIYSIDTNGAKVSFSVRTNQRTKVSSSDFRVYVDMRDYSITGALPVYVSVDERVRDIVSDVSVSPLVVHATTEDMQEKTFDIEPSIVGTPADGFAAGNVNYSPSHVTLYGPSSEIGRISHIGFNVIVSDASSDVWGPAEFMSYDAAGNQINIDSQVVIKNSASYKVPVYRKKTVSIMMQTSGEPAEGYELGRVDCEPDFIEVYGEDKVLNSINALILPSSLLNINNASADVFASINPADYLPEGLYTANVGNIALVARIHKTGITMPGDDEKAETEESSEAEKTEEQEAESNEATDESAAAGGHSVLIHQPADEDKGDNSSE